MFGGTNLCGRGVAFSHRLRGIPAQNQEVQQHFPAAAYKAQWRDARGLEQSVEYMQSASEHLWH